MVSENECDIEFVRKYMFQDVSTTVTSPYILPFPHRNTLTRPEIFCETVGALKFVLTPPPPFWIEIAKHSTAMSLIHTNILLSVPSVTIR